MKADTKGTAKVCDICGEKFTPRVYWQKHCSKACRQAAWVLKKLSGKVLRKLQLGAKNGI